MSDSTPPVTSATVLIWMHIADVVLQEGGLAIDAKIIYDELTQKTLPANVNEAFEQMQHIRRQARELQHARLADRQITKMRRSEATIDEEND